MIIEDDNLVAFIEITNKYKDQNFSYCRSVYCYRFSRDYLLCDVMEIGAIKILNHLLQFNSVNEVFEYRRTLLHIAVIDNRNRKIIKLLLSHKPNLNLKEDCGKTALVIAVENNNEKIVKLLLKSAASSNQQIINKEKPLYIAVMGHNRKIVKLLLKYGADPNKEEPDKYLSLAYCASMDKQYSLLHHAATEKNNEEIVKLLLKYGADPNKEDKCGQTPLQSAAWYGCKRSFVILYEVTDKKYKSDQSILEFIKQHDLSDEILMKTSINIILQSYEFDTTSLFSQDYLCRDMLALILKQAKNEEYLIRCEKKINKENKTSNNP